MADAEALQHIGGIVDLGADLRSSEITDKAFQLLGARSLSEVHEALRLYHAGMIVVHCLALS